MEELTNYEDGDVVWVKLGNCWWPGEVCSESRLPQGILKAVRKKPLFIVRFFDESKYEYVKNINNICKYDDTRKSEFIRKGLDLLRSNRKYMEKFPVDVSHAERITDGDVDIISREQFSPVKKVSYTNIFGDSATKKKPNGNKKSPGKRSVGRKSKTTFIEPTRKLERKVDISTTAYIAPRLTALSLTSQLANTSPEAYNCQMCPFTTTRCNILIMHMKTHTKSSIPRNSDDAQEELESESQTLNQCKEQFEEDFTKRLYSKFQPSVCHDSDIENDVEDDYAEKCKSDVSKIMDPPKKRKQPKKPGLKHIILADWSEDDDDDTENNENENNDMNMSQPEPKYATDDCTKSIEKISTDVQNSTVEQQENVLTTERGISVHKYRNIPKKDRRDIILSEFNTSTILSEESDKHSTAEPLILERHEISEIDSSELVSEANTDSDKVNLSESPPNSSTSIIPEVDHQELVENNSEQNSLEDIETKSAPQSTVEREREIKATSCFDFKDDDDDDNEDVLSSFSKLKQKYMSPEKNKSTDEEIPLEMEQDQKDVEEKDMQLAADIENLLNATTTPEFSKVETESIPQDVRALPPKERGKRIFKSRNRPKLEKLEESNTVITSNFIMTEIEQQESNIHENYSNTDNVTNDVSTCQVNVPLIEKRDNLRNDDDELPSNVSLTNNDNSKCNNTDIVIHVTGDERESDELLIKADPNEFTTTRRRRKRYYGRRSKLDRSEIKTQVENEQTKNNFVDECENEVSGLENTNVNDYPLTGQQSDGNRLENNEPLEATVVDVSEGNSNFLIANNEHDLNVLAAAETLLSMPSKLCAENRLETVITALEYLPEANQDALEANNYSVYVQDEPGYERETIISEAGNSETNPVKVEPDTNQNSSNIEYDILHIAVEAENIAEESIENTEVIDSSVLYEDSTVNTRKNKSKKRQKQSVASTQKKLRRNKDDMLSKNVVNEEDDGDKDTVIPDNNIIAPPSPVSRRRRNLRRNTTKIVKHLDVPPHTIDDSEHLTDVNAVQSERENIYPGDETFSNKEEIPTTAHITVESNTAEMDAFATVLNEPKIKQRKKRSAVSSKSHPDEINIETVDVPQGISEQAGDIHPDRSDFADNDLLENQSEISPSIETAEKQVDLDFEKLDLGQLQTHAEHNDSNSNTDGEKLSPVGREQLTTNNHNETSEDSILQSRNLDESTIGMNSDVTSAEEPHHLYGTFNKGPQEILSNESNGYENSSKQTEQYEETRMPTRQKSMTRQYSIPDCENRTLTKVANIRITDMVSLESQSTEHLADSEEKNLVIDTQPFETSESSEIHNEHTNEFDDNTDAVVTDNLYETISDEKNTSNDEEKENEHANLEKDVREYIEAEEINAAEQILDELSNITSSIDVILENERVHEEAQRKSLEGRAEDTLEEREIETNSIQINIDTSGDTDKELQHGELLDEDPVKPLLETPNELETLEADTLDEPQLLSTNSSENNEVRSVSNRKRRSHLKYTPPKVVALESPQDDVAFECSSEVIDNTQSGSKDVLEERIILSDSNDIVTSKVLTIDSETLSNRKQVKGTKKHQICTIVNNEIISEVPTAPFEQCEIITECEDNTLKTDTTLTPIEPNYETVSHGILTINMNQLEGKLVKPLKQQQKTIIEPKKSRILFEETVEVTSSTEAVDQKSVLYGPNKRRFPRLKEQTIRTSTMSALDDGQQHGIDVFEFSEQDAVDTPKKSKCTISKESKSQSSSRSVNKVRGRPDTSKSRTNTSEKSKHSRSKQLSFQDLIDVNISKYHKTDRAKRSIQHVASNDGLKSTFRFTESRFRGDGHLASAADDIVAEKAEASNNKIILQSSNSDATTFGVEAVSPVPSTQTSSHNINVYSMFNTHPNAAAGSVSTTTYMAANVDAPGCTTNKRKAPRVAANQGRKQKQQQPQQIIQQEIIPQDFSESYVQQSLELAVPQTVCTRKANKRVSKPPVSRRQMFNNFGETLPSFPLNQLSINEKRGQVISSETIAIAGSPITPPQKGRGVEACGADTMIITSEGKILVSGSNTSTYSAGYFESRQQRAPNLDFSSTISHSAPLRTLGSRSYGNTSVKCIFNNSDPSNDTANAAFNLAEIKRLEQKPTGNVLTAHGFTKLEIMENNVIHNVSVLDAGVHIPDLVPINEPHSTQRVATKGSNSHSTQEMTNKTMKGSKHMRSGLINLVSQPNLLAGDAAFDTSGEHLSQEHLIHEISDNVQSLFGHQPVEIQTLPQLQIIQTHQQSEEPTHYQVLVPTQFDQQCLQIQGLEEAEQIKLFQQLHDSQSLTKRRRVDHEYADVQQEDLQEENLEVMELPHMPYELDDDQQEHLIFHQPHHVLQNQEHHLQLQHEQELQVQLDEEQDLQIQVHEEQELQVQLSEEHAHHFRHPQTQQFLIVNKKLSDDERIRIEEKGDQILIHDDRDKHGEAKNFSPDDENYITHKMGSSDESDDLLNENSPIHAVEISAQDVMIAPLDSGCNVIQLEETVDLNDTHIEYQLIHNPRTAATSETNAIMPPIMSALENPSSTNELVLKSNKTGLIGRSLDDSLASLGVGTQSSSARVSLELPITVTNPAIASKSSNSINVGNLYGSRLSHQSQMSSALASQDHGQLAFELFSSSNVISSPSLDQHSASIFSDNGNFKTNEHQTIHISGLETNGMDNIILHPVTRSLNRAGEIIQPSNYIITGDQFTVVGNQVTSDSNTIYSNPGR